MTQTAEQEIQDDIRAVQDISSIAIMLGVICRITGMGFAAIAPTASRKHRCVRAPKAGR